MDGCEILHQLKTVVFTSHYLSGFYRVSTILLVVHVFFHRGYFDMTHMDSWLKNMSFVEGPGIPQCPAT